MSQETQSPRGRSLDPKIKSEAAVFLLWNVYTRHLRPPRQHHYTGQTWGPGRSHCPRSHGRTGPESCKERKWGHSQLCPTLWDPMDCRLWSSSVHGVLQARILKWFAIPFSRGSSRPRDRTQVSRIVGRRFTIWATREESYKLLWTRPCQLIEKLVWRGYPACLLKTHPHPPSLVFHQGGTRPPLWALPVSSDIPAACLLTSHHSHWSFRCSTTSSGKDWRWELVLLGVGGLEAQCLKNLTALQNNLHWWLRFHSKENS